MAIIWMPINLIPSSFLSMRLDLQLYSHNIIDNILPTLFIYFCQLYLINNVPTSIQYISNILNISIILITHQMLDPFAFDNHDQKKISTGEAQWTQLKESLYQFYPYNCIGIVQTFKMQQQITATCFLISSCLALTTAHTFFSFQNGKPKYNEIKPITVYTNIIGDLDQQKSCRVTSYKVCPKYIECMQKTKEMRAKMLKIKSSTMPSAQKQNEIYKIESQCYKVKKETNYYDYALLKLQKIIERDKYAKIKPIDKTLKNVVSVAGYYQHLNKFYIYHHSNDIHIRQNYGYYAIDTQSGQSGSPVFIKNSERGQIIGMHKGYDPSLNRNVCTLFTLEMIKQLEQWAHEFNVQKALFKPFFSANSSIIIIQQQKGNYQKQTLISQNKSLKQQIQQLQLHKTELKEEYVMVKNKYKQFIEYTDGQYIKSMAQTKSLKQKLANTEQLLAGKTDQEQKLRELLLQVTNIGSNGLQTSINHQHQTTSNVAHPQNPHNQFFIYQGNDQRFTITKLGKDKDFYAFIKQGQIPPNRITVFQIRQIRTFAKHIYTGIATKKAFGVLTPQLKSAQIITYNSKYGDVYENGKVKSFGTTVGDGEAVYLIVNTRQWRIRWSKEFSVIAQWQISQKLRSQPLYLAVLMNASDDKVEVLQVPFFNA